MWEKVDTMNPPSMQYTQYKEDKGKLLDGPTCFCLPLRSGVLAIGLLGSTLAISGLAAYAIVQVPTLRVHVGQYFTNTTDTSLQGIAYTSEVVGAIIGASAGLLVNILLVFGVLWNRRWFLIHWLVFHVLSLVLLFITSILIFVVQPVLWKLMGIVPVVLAFLTMYCWAKVYELFGSLYPSPDKKQKPHLPPPVLLPPHPWQPHPERDGRAISMERVQELGPGVEFYPVDSLSRGMVDRMSMMDRSMPNMVYLPYDNMDDNWGRMSQHECHQYQPSTASTASSIVRYSKEDSEEQTVI